MIFAFTILETALRSNAVLLLAEPTETPGTEADDQKTEFYSCQNSLDESDRGTIGEQDRDRSWFDAECSVIETPRHKVVRQETTKETAMTSSECDDSDVQDLVQSLQQTPRYRPAEKPKIDYGFWKNFKAHRPWDKIPKV